MKNTFGRMLQSGRQINIDHNEIPRMAREASVSLAGGMVGRVINFLGQMTLARLLGPEAFGLYAIAWTIFRVGDVIAPLGLHNGVIRYGAHYWGADQSRLKGVLVQALCLALLSGLLIGISLYVMAPWVANHVFGKPDLTPAMRWFTPAFVLSSGLAVAVAATRISQHMKYSVYANDITQPITNLLLIPVFYMIGGGLFGAVAASVSSFGISLILALYYVRQLFPEVFSSEIKSAHPTKELVAFSLPTAFAGMFGLLNLWIDRLLVGYFRPAAEVGIYQVVSQFSLFFVFILNAFGVIFSPMIADLYHKRQLQRLNVLFKINTKWGLYFSLPLSLIMILMPDELIAAVFGDNYEGGSLPLVILTVAQLVNVGTGAISRLLVMTGHQSYWFLISATMLFVNVTVDLLLIPRLGIAGAAIGTACAVSGLFLWGLFQVKHSLGIWPYDRRYLKGMLATVLAICVLLFLRTLETGSLELNLLLSLIMSSGIFGATLILMGLDAEDQEVIALIRKRFSF